MMCAEDEEPLESRQSRERRTCRFGTCCAAYRSWCVVVRTYFMEIDLSKRFHDTRNADTFPTLICRGRRCGQTGVKCCERVGPTAHSISFLVGYIKDLGFRRMVVKCDNEPSTKSLQDVVIQAFAGAEVVPQDPPEGDRMANGRVEMTAREVKRQCRTLWISVEQQTSARVADDSPMLSWLPRFCSTFHEQNEIWCRWKNERTETNRTKIEETHGTIWRTGCRHNRSSPTTAGMVL